MLMTENDASEKWCPFAMTSNGLSTRPARNRTEVPNQILAGVTCIASRCMAWVFVAEPESVVDGGSNLLAQRSELPRGQCTALRAR